MIWPIWPRLGEKYKNIFIWLLIQMKTSKFAFEINWPLGISNFWCASVSILHTHENWKHSTSYFASLSLLYQFKCGKKFMLQNIPFSCLNAINYIYSLAAGINVFTEKRNGLLRQSFLLFPLWQTAVFGRFTSPGIDQTAVQWDQIIF